MIFAELEILEDAASAGKMWSNQASGEGHLD
jgi:hypothetical protein